MFCDVAGSTALGETLDPESLRRVMDRYFEAMRDPIEHHGGTIEKFIGDAVMAVFGIPQVHEDDAVRAVRAADGMRAALRKLNQELGRDHGVTVENRIGLTTGEVVASEAAAGDRLVTGDAVNTAARLEQAAGVGEVLLGDPTYRLVRDVVEAEQVGPIEAKGKVEPVTAWRLLGVRDPVGAESRRRGAEMVGREHELRSLADAFERATHERACVLVTILGSAGIGKSRLVDEFLMRIGEGTLVLRGRCLSYGEGITYWPLIEMLSEAGHLAEVDARAEVLGKLQALVEPAPDAKVIAQRLAHLFGLEGAQADPEETFWAVRRTFETLSGRAPLIVDLDDLHWAEPTLLDLIEHVADWSRGAPILLLCSARSEMLDERPGWGGGKMNAISFLLEPLAGNETELLTRRLLGEAAQRSIVERVASASEGNPFFVEQMAAMLAEGIDHPEDAGPDVAVPPTIQALLSARLDRLAPAERAAIECASIEGKVFHRMGVFALAGDGLRSSVDAHLGALVRRDLVRPDAPDFAGEGTFRFRHQLIRDAAYASIPKERRAELHDRFAAWLEATVPDHIELDEIVAYHLERVYAFRSELGPLDRRTRELGNRAAELLMEAGDRSADRGDERAASSLWRRAIELLPEGDPLAPVLSCAAARALVRTGELAIALSVVERAIRRASEAGDDDVVAGLGAVLGLVGGLIDGDRYPSERTVELHAEAELRLGSPECRRLLGWVRESGAVAHHWRGRQSEAIRVSDLILTDPVASRDRFLVRVVERTRLVSQLWGSTPIQEIWPNSDELGDPTIQAEVLGAAGIARAMTGDAEGARDLSRRAIERAEQLGDTRTWPFAWAGVVELLLGRPDFAEPRLRAGHEAAIRDQSVGFGHTIAGWWARALHEVGLDEEALEILRANADTPRDDYEAIALQRAAHAQILAARGELEEAERLAREGLSAVEPTEDLMRHGLILLSLAEVLRRAGRGDEAEAAAREALALFERKGDLPDADRARALLG